MKDYEFLKRKDNFLKEKMPNPVSLLVNFSAQLRKQKKEKILCEKRAKIMNICEVDSKAPLDHDSMLKILNDFAVFPISIDAPIVEKIKVAIAGLSISSKNNEIIYMLLKFIRESLASLDTLLIETAISYDLLPKLAEFLESPEDKIIMEAGWCITNIAAAESTSYNLVTALQKKDIHNKLIKQLYNPNDLVREQALWALNNMIGDNESTAKNEIMMNPLFFPIFREIMLRNLMQIRFLRTICWTSYNILIKKMEIPAEWIKLFIERMALFINVGDKESLYDCLRSMDLICQISEENIEQFISRVKIERVLEIIIDDDENLARVAIKLCDTISSSTNMIAKNYLAQAGIIPICERILNSTTGIDFSREILENACHILSNLCNGSIEVIQKIIEKKGIEILSLLALHSSDFEIQKDSAIGLIFCILNGNNEIIRKLFEYEIIETLARLLEKMHDENKILSYLLDAIIKLLENEGEEDHYSEIFDKKGGVREIEQLQLHSNEEIYGKAVKIIETFYKAVEATKEELEQKVEENREGS